MTSKNSNRLGARLWKIGVGLLAALATCAIGNRFIAPDRAIASNELGHDFLAFYYAGDCVRDGRDAELYDLDKTRSFQHALATREGLVIGDGFGPWWNPPFYAWVFAPLAGLPYHAALRIWSEITVACLALAMLLLAGMLKPVGDFGRQSDRVFGARLLPADASPLTWKTWGLIPLLVLTSSPFLQAFNHGQNTFTSLLLLAGVVAFWRRRNAMAAGLTAGLLFYKPQLGLVVAIVLVFDLGWRALGGLLITGAALAMVALYFTPDATVDYRWQLAANLRTMQIESPYLWERHVTFKGFYRLILQGRQAGEAIIAVKLMTAISVAAWAAALVWFALRSAAAARRKAISAIVHTDRLIAATVATMPLLMPFYFDYDLLLLAVPATLLAADLRRSAGRADRTDRLLPAAMIALGFALYANAGLGKFTHVNIATILLAVVAALFIARLRKSSVAVEAAADVPDAMPALA